MTDANNANKANVPNFGRKQTERQFLSHTDKDLVTLNTLSTRQNVLFSAFIAFFTFGFAVSVCSLRVCHVGMGGLCSRW